MENLDPCKLLFWNHWVTYASSCKEQKRLLAKAGESIYRVTHGQNVVFEGSSATAAVLTYNRIKEQPENKDS